MRWLDKLLNRQPPPDRITPDAARDPAYYEARERYQQDKQAAMQKQIDLLARINRLGYEVDVVARRARDERQ